MAEPGNAASLIPGVLAGDPQALDRFAEHWGPVVLRWCARVGGPRVDAEDAAHDVFEIVLSRLHTLRDPRALPGWLYQVTRRTVIDHRRRAWLRRWVPAVFVDRPTELPGPEREVSDSDVARRVHRVLDGLPTDLREVLVLCELEERTAIEVSDLVGVPLGTVKSRLRRAREQFGRDALRAGLTPDSTLEAAEADVG